METGRTMRACAARGKPGRVIRGPHGQERGMVARRRERVRECKMVLPARGRQSGRRGFCQRGRSAWDRQRIRVVSAGQLGSSTALVPRSYIAPAIAPATAPQEGWPSTGTNLGAGELAGELDAAQHGRIDDIAGEAIVENVAQAQVQVEQDFRGARESMQLNSTAIGDWPLEEMRCCACQSRFMRSAVRARSLPRFIPPMTSSGVMASRRALVSGWTAAGVGGVAGALQAISHRALNAPTEASIPRCPRHPHCIPFWWLACPSLFSIPGARLWFRDDRLLS